MKSKLMSSPSPGRSEQVHEPVRIHRIGQRIQVVEAVVVLEERVQQPALVPAAVLRDRGDDQVRRAVAMHLAVHAEALGEAHRSSAPA